MRVDYHGVRTDVRQTNRADVFFAEGFQMGRRRSTTFGARSALEQDRLRSKIGFGRRRAHTGKRKCDRTRRIRSVGERRGPASLFKTLRRFPFASEFGPAETTNVKKQTKSAEAVDELMKTNVREHFAD